MTTISIWLPSAQYDRWKELVRKTGGNASKLVQGWIDVSYPVISKKSSELTKNVVARIVVEALEKLERRTLKVQDLPVPSYRAGARSA